MTRWTSSGLSPRPALALLGPTAVGKTGLAASLAACEPCHLISCDAVQVYRGLETAAAKPDASELRERWALIDWLDPDEEGDLGLWVRAAEAELARAWDRSQLPLIVGGTGMYLRGLAKGLAPVPRRDPRVRARIARITDKHGIRAIHRILARLDPETAQRLHATDTQRLQRALEVFVTAGRSLSDLQADWDRPDRFPLRRVALSLPRDVLYERINRRVEQFFAAGLVNEVRTLLHDRGLAPNAPALRAIGYREVTAWLLDSGSRPHADPPEELIATVQRNTRRYAKRQMTWLRSEPDLTWIDARDPHRLDKLVTLARP